MIIRNLKIKKKEMLINQSIRNHKYDYDSYIAAT